MSGRRWLPPVLWAGLILTLTSIPTPQVGSASGLDKLVHLLLYAVLGFLAARAAAGDRPSAWKSNLLVLSAVVLFAGVDEWHQAFIPGRSPELLDWLADAVGAALGTILVAAGRQRREQPLA